MNYSATGDFIEKKNIKENFSNSNIEHWSADNLIYTSDGKVGIGKRDPEKELDINGDIRIKNLCMLNENNEEVCINAAFLVLAKELILGVMPKEYRDFNLINSFSKNDIVNNLIPSQMNSENENNNWD